MVALSKFTGTMASKANKGKEVDPTTTGFKRLRKDTKGASSSATKATPARRFGAKVVEPHGLNMVQHIEGGQVCS